MTQEEKAKAYDKVREKIAIRFGSNVAKEIFSEYEESEDEKMRKELISLVKETRVTDRYYDLNKMLAWLERQGEQKSIDDLTPQEAMDIAVAKCFEQDEQKPNPCDGCINHKGCINCENGELRETEQKPALVEPKFKVGDKIISTISNIPYYITEVCNGYYLTDVGCIIMFNAQNNFKLVEQNPAAWSEEDEKMLNQIIKDYERGNKSWLKGQGSLPFGNRIKWLKSLRPQNTWKPSDEQMNLLGELVEDNNQRYFYTILRSLYEQLKKLREE